MIRAILIDDEKHCIESLALDLEKYCPTVDICKQVTSSKEGLKLIKELKPDLVFLDIEMPWMNGFELLECLSPIDFEVIFVTAYDSYAVKAFKVNAVDYLMKPIDKDDLITAVNKVEAKLNNDSKPDDRIHNLLHQYFNSLPNKKVVFAERDRQKIVDPADIVFVKAEGNYATIYIENQKPLTLSMTLKAIETKIDNNRFLRIHHSYLVNMDKVSQYSKTEGGFLVMNEGTTVPISRTKRPILKTFLEEDFK